MSKTHFVKYHDGVLKNWKGYEEFQTATGTYRAIFERTLNGYIAKDVPEGIATKLHRSEAYDIVDEKGVVPPEFADGASPHGKLKPKAGFESPQSSAEPPAPQKSPTKPASK